ncbi:MAG: 30S ribosomal protein S9 [Candidatus Omnitrophota bacterium]|nr:30S ribosomal protein S9 [Candidatus Omnitrophota bacterium]
MDQITRITTVGRRKEAIARVALLPGKGNILVNKEPYEKYFIRETDRIIIKQPLLITNNLDKYDVVANISGGGPTGQAGALRLGIARALLLSQPELKDSLRKHGFLTRDPRMKERKKYGQKGARKRFQWTKR